MAKSILMVIAQKDFRDEELATPRQTFEKAGAKVTVAAPSKERAKGMLGAVVDPDLALADANVGDYDAVVFVGGSGAQSLYDDTTAQALAQATVKADKVLGAICLAPGILARAGLLNGKSCTVWKSEAGSLRAAGANYKDEAVVVDGKLVTGNGPEAAQEFADALVKTLGQSSEGALTPQAPPAAPPTGRPPAR